MRFAAWFLCAAVVLVNCTGGALPPSSPGSQATAERQASSAQRKTGRLVVLVLVPHRTHTVRLRVMRGGRPQYISASTVAMTLAISNGSKLVVNRTVPLTPSSPNCTKTSTGTACTTSVVLKACPTKAACYTASVSTYDAIFCNGAPPVCSIPSNANELSTDQNVPFAVATGVANTVSLTLSGVPHSTTFTPDDLTNPNGGTFELIGPGAHAFTAQTLDAAGNIIVGPGAPTYAASTPAGSLAGVTVATPSSAPNQIWVSPPATFDGTGTASFDVAPTFAGQSTDGCAQPQAVCTATTLTVGMERMYAIANAGNLQLYGFGESTPRVNITVGTGQGLATDGAGDIFMATGSAIVLKPPLGQNEAGLPCCSGATVGAVASGAGGSAFFLATYPYTFPAPQNSISSCSLIACQMTAYILPYNQNQVMAADAAGDVAYGNPSSSNGSPCFAYVYDAPNYTAPLKITGGLLNVAGCAMLVALDPGGNLFVDDPNNSQIVEFSKSSGYQTATRIATGSAYLLALLTDSSGDVLDVARIPGPGAVIQETLATSLTANQGGSLSPDDTATLPVTGYLQNASATIAPDGIYVSWYACCTYQPTFAGYSLPGLTSLGAPTNEQAYQPTGLLVLP